MLLTALLAVEGARRFTSGPLRATLGRTSAELKVAVCHRQALRRVRHLRSRGAGEALRLNIGCGARVRAGWLNIDLGAGADLRLDIRRPLPFADSSCAEIYCEHLLEHLAYPGEVLTVLHDWHRVLVPGGRLSVGVPDTVAPLRDYVTGATDYFEWCRTHPWYPPWIETRMDQINFHFRQQGLGFGLDHLYAYDLDTLAARLTAVGFTDIAERPFDPSRDSRPGTLYVDATKATG